MPKTLNFDRFQDFLNHNRQEMMSNYFTYYHFIQTVKMLNAGTMDVFAAYNVQDDDGSDIICVWTTGHYFLYGNQWNDEVLAYLTKEIQFEKLKNFNFLGRTELILALLEKQKISYEILKDRIVYECTSVKNDIVLNEAYNIENADVNDFNELVQMDKDNYVEEYRGEGQKTVEQMAAGIASGIENNKLFVLKDEEGICSMMQVINDRQSLPMIGNLYTKEQKRNNGCAVNLLYAITEGLFANGAKKCGLVSDKTNPASNKVFLKVGYVPVYNWAIVFKD